MLMHSLRGRLPHTNNLARKAQARPPRFPILSSPLVLLLPPVPCPCLLGHFFFFPPYIQGENEELIRRLTLFPWFVGATSRSAASPPLCSNSSNRLTLSVRLSAHRFRQSLCLRTASQARCLCASRARISSCLSAAHKARRTWLSRRTTAPSLFLMARLIFCFILFASYSLLHLLSAHHCQTFSSVPELVRAYVSAGFDFSQRMWSSDVALTTFYPFGTST
jgi:hypothetical protein